MPPGAQTQCPNSQQKSRYLGQWISGISIDCLLTTCNCGTIGAIHRAREIQHRSAIRRATLGMLFHRHGQSLQLQLQLASGPQSPGSPSLIRQRKGDTNEQVRATRGVDRFEVTVEADAEWSCSVQKVLPEPRPHDCQTLNPSSSRISDTTLNGLPLETLHARRQGAEVTFGNEHSSIEERRRKEQPSPTLP